MARNRKRAKERRNRRPASSQVSRPGVATARAEREAHEVETPSPLEHATPDVELADAQLAVGRPDLVADLNGESAPQTRDAPEDESVVDEPEVPLDEESVIDEPEVPLDEQEFEDEEDFADEAMESRGGGGGAGRVGGGSGGADGGGDGGGGELAVPAAGAPAQRRHAGNRLIKTAWWTTDRVHYWESVQGTSGRGKQLAHELLMALGVDLGKLEGWDALADELAVREGSIYEVRVERRGDFLNTFIEGKPQGVQERMAVPAGAASTSDVPIDTADFERRSPPPPDDDDIPF